MKLKAAILILIVAFLSFEIVNYSMTELALNDVLGNLAFVGIRWATILAIAFCAIDFTVIARLFSSGDSEPTGVWYFFGAWVLATAMNATLTWWGVSVAIAHHTSANTNSLLQNFGPVFIAIMVWVIRILIMGTISLRGQLFVEKRS